MKTSECPESSACGYLFVYGTLRSGFKSHGLLQKLNARFVAVGYTRGRLYDLGEYPGAVETAGDGDRVYGEVYQLPRPEQALTVLDRFEGFDPARPSGNLFERKEATVEVAGGGRMQTWIYWLRRRYHKAQRVQAGNYSMRRS